MEELESAVRLALDPATAEPLKSQARVYCEQLRNSETGWQLCLSLFLKADPQTSPVAVRFFSLSVIEESLRTKKEIILPLPLKELRVSLWSWLQSRLCESEPVFLRNKLATVIVLLFQLSYLSSWTEFFDDLLLLAATPSRHQPENTGGNILYLDFFLRVCGIIDEETVAGQTRDTVSQTALKDAMRESATKRLTEAWLAVLSNPQIPDDLVIMVYRLFGLYVAWIDIQLVVNDRFMYLLFKDLVSSSSSVRVAATECLADVVAKGMAPMEKMALIQGLKVPELLHQLVAQDATTNSDVDATDIDSSIAKLLNITGLEICSSFEASHYSQDLQPLAIDLLNKVYAPLLSILSRVDSEILSIPFSFLTALFGLLKKYKKTSKNAETLQIPSLKEKLSALLRLLLLKMRHDVDDTFTLLSEANEEDTFSVMRKEIKNYFDSIFALEPNMYEAFVSSAVCSTFESFAQNKSSVSWVDAELAIYMVLIHYETQKAPCAFIIPDSEPLVKTPMGQMLSKLVMTNISSYPHFSIQLIYFETITRYAVFFEDFPDHLPLTLASFVDERGLHHPNTSVRNRVSYHFLRFVKTIREKLRPYVGQLIHSLSDRLNILPPTTSESENQRQSKSSCSSPAESRSDFESQLFLFEAFGKLISYESMLDMQAEYLSTVVGPIMNQMQETLKLATFEKSLGNLIFLNRLIVSVGSIGKGFPDIEGSSSSVPAPPHTVFVPAFQVMMTVLEHLSSEHVIRDAVRFALQRLVGCLGPDIVSEILPMIKSGLILSHSTMELIEFLKFTAMLTFKFGARFFNVGRHARSYLCCTIKTAFTPVLHDLMLPLHERVTSFLSQEMSGTDDVFENAELKRAYLSFFASILNTDQECILTSKANLPFLPAILRIILKSMKDFSDIQSQKIACAVLVKMVTAWGQDPETAQPSFAGDGKSLKKSTTIEKLEAKRSKPPLSGFDQFIYESLVPILFEIPYQLDKTDSQSVLLTEIATFHKAIYNAQGPKYLNYLANIAFPSLQISSEPSQAFLNALATLEVKAFKNFLQEFVASTRR